MARVVNMKTLIRLGKVLHTVFVFAVVILLPFLTMSGATQEQVTLQQRCGIQRPFEGTLDVWSAQSQPQLPTQVRLVPTEENSIRDGVTLIATQTQRDFDVRETTSGVPFRIIDRIVLDAGVAILHKIGELGDPRPPVTLVVITDTGETYEITDDNLPDGLNWWKLLPQSEPGVFGLFGYRNLDNTPQSRQAFLIEVRLSSTGIQLGTRIDLPFKFSTFANPWILHVSPDYRYIAFWDSFDGQTQTYFIYDVEAARFVWQTPLGGFPDVTWVNSAETVALVTDTQATQGQIIAVHTNGSASTVFDVAQNLEEGTRLSFTTRTTSLDRVVFWAYTPEIEDTTAKLLIYEPATRTLIDFCIQVEATYVFTDQTHLFFTTSNRVAQQILILNISTGDYSLIQPNQRIRLMGLENSEIVLP